MLLFLLDCIVCKLLLAWLVAVKKRDINLCNNNNNCIFLIILCGRLFPTHSPNFHMVPFPYSSMEIIYFPVDFQCNTNITIRCHLYIFKAIVLKLLIIFISISHIMGYLCRIKTQTRSARSSVFTAKEQK